MTHNELIKLIETGAKRRGIAEATFCRLAVGNNRLYRTLKAGGSCTIEIAERVKAFAGPQGEDESPQSSDEKGKAA